MSIDFSTTHPRNPYRSKALEKTIAEIEGKRASGLPLEPEMKEDAKP